MPPPTGPFDQPFDHSSDPNFLAYYAAQSESAATLQRFGLVRDKALQLISRQRAISQPLQVLDIGCGAGTQARLWATLGHRVTGLDVNAPLVAVARARAGEQALAIRFDVGTATRLPYADASMDVCLMPELLEHVQDWQSCLREAVRVLRPGGLLYLSTTSALCPVQDEFNLPLYSWYPGFLKRRWQRLAVSTRPDVANHARYPAVHWFTVYGLRRFLKPLGITLSDRFDMIDTRHRPLAQRLALGLLRALPPLRFIGHVATPGTTVFGLKLGA